MRWGAVILAAGRGTRFGRPKQLIDIAGAPMLAWSIRTFQAMAEISDVVVVTEAAWLEEVAGVARSCAVVPGGPTRALSSYRGVRALPPRCAAVLVHDGARPLVACDDVRRAMQPVAPGHASLLAIPVVDTIKIVDSAGGIVQKTLDRSVLWAAQTPQFAMLADMRRAHEGGIRDGIDATDDAMLLERIGVRVHAVQGCAQNFKVTVPEDRTRADEILRARAQPR